MPSRSGDRGLRFATSSFRPLGDSGVAINSRLVKRSTAPKVLRTMDSSLSEEHQNGSNGASSVPSFCLWILWFAADGDPSQHRCALLARYPSSAGRSSAR